STLAYELVGRGWSLLSEDLSRLTQKDDRMIAWPGTGFFRLRPDACRRFGLHTDSLPRASGGQDKFLAAVGVRTEPAPLSTIVCLQRVPEVAPAEPGAGAVTSITGARAMALLTEHVYRRRYAIALGLIRQHIRLLGVLRSSTRVLRLD